MIRSLFAFAAAAWFAYNAIWFEGGGDSGVDSARMLCVGLALAGLALVDWDWVKPPQGELIEPPVLEDE